MDDQLRAYLAGELPGQNASLSQVTPDYSASQIWGAAFEDSNIVGSLLASQSIREGIAPSDRTPVSDEQLNQLITDRGHQSYVDRYLDVTTVGEANALANDLDRELENDDILANAGWTGFGAGLVAGFFDLPTLLPFGHALKLGKAGYQAANAARAAAKPTLRQTASRLAVTSMLDATVTEAALHGSQETRTLEESMFGVGASVLLTTAVGTGIARGLQTETFHNLSNRLGITLRGLADGDAKVAESLDGVAARMRGEADGPLGQGGTGNPFGGPKLLGGPPNQGKTWDVDSERMTPSQMALAKAWGIPKAAQVVSKLFGGNIMLDMMHAKSHSARELIANLDDLPMQLKGEFEGQAAPIAAMQLKARLDGVHATATREFIDAYRSWRKGLDLSGKDLARFSRLVTAANADGDVAADPLVQRAALATRRLHTEVAEMNIRAGLMRRSALIKPDNTANARPDGPIISGREELTGPRTGLGAPTDGQPSPLGSQVTGRKPGDQKAIGASRHITERRDSPEYLSLDDFRRSAKRGRIGRALKSAQPRDVSDPRAAGENLDAVKFDPGTDAPKLSATSSKEFDLLERIDQMLIDGDKPEDIARTIAHEWALKNDKKYAEKWKAHTDERKRRPRMPEDVLRAAHEAIVEQRTKYELSGNKPRASAEIPGDQSNASLGALAKIEEPPQGVPPERIIADDDPRYFADPKSYLKIIFRQDRILHEEAEFVKTEARAFLQQWRSPSGKAIGELPKQARLQVYQKALRHAKGVYTAIVHNHNLDGQSHTGNIRNAGNRRGSVLERNSFIPPKELLKRGWIEDDALLLMNRSLRQNGTDAVLAMRFRRAPSPADIRMAEAKHPHAYWVDGEDPTTLPDLDLKEPKARIAAEYDDLIFEAKTDAERIALRKERALMLDHAETAIELLRGTYQGAGFNDGAARNLAAVRDWQFSTMMGNIILSSLPDTALVMAQHGPFRVAGYATKRMLSRVPELFQGLDKKSIVRLRREARAAGVAIETESMQRVTGYADIHDPFSSAESDLTMFQRTARGAAFAASRGFGIVYWNNALQRISHGMFMDRIFRHALTPGDMTKRDKDWLKSIGATDDFMKRLSAQARNDNLMEDGGVYLPDTSNWDVKMQEQFFALARKSARQSVINPGVLEKPLMTHNQWGSTILQFTGYVFASTLRVTASMAARAHSDRYIGKDALNIYLTMASLMTMGAVGTMLRYVAAGREDEIPSVEENPGWWLYESLDRSGMLGMFGHINNLVESNVPYSGLKLPGLREGAQRLFGDESAHVGSTAKSRPRSPGEVLMGPVGSTVGNLFNVGNDLLRAPFSDDGTITSGTIRSTRRLTPLADGALWRPITAAGERYIVEELLGDDYRP
jgi:hypothetical protein